MTIKQKSWPCIETTVDCMVDDYNVRLWINKKAIPNDHRREQELFNKLRMLRGYNISSLIQKIINTMPKDMTLNAIQIRDGMVGTVVYCVEFNDNVHG